MVSILLLTQRMPYPPIKGEKIRGYRILGHLRRSFDVYLGTLVDDPADRAHLDTVRALCADAYFAPIGRKRAKLSCLSGLLTGEPLSVAFFRNAGLQRWVDRTLTRVQPDAVLVCSGNMAPYVLGRPFRANVQVVDLVDVDSEKWRTYSLDANALMRWVYQREARLTFDLERRIAREADATTFVSEAEARLFRQLVPEVAGRVHAVSNGVDYEYFDPTRRHPPPYDPKCPTFVFTGTMDYRPNVDAVLWFVREILPIVRRELPDVQFFVVGSSPAREVIKLSDIDGVHVTGRVPDVRPFLAHATGCVCPLRIARGIQNKVLESMAMAQPTIVTPDALEGIDARPGHEVLLAENTSQFAAAAIWTARYPEEAARIGIAARRQIERRYSWSAQLPGFDRIIGRNHFPSVSDADGRLAL